MKKSPTKKKAKRPSPSKESQRRYLRGNKAIVKAEDGLPAMQRCLYLATLSILKDLEAHEAGKKVISLRDRVGIFSQFAEKVRLFEGKSTSIEEHKHSLVEQIIMIMAEERSKINGNPRLKNLQN